MPPKKKFFCVCPHCGFSKTSGAKREKLVGGPKFGKNIVSLAAIVTGVRVIDIAGKPKKTLFSQARTSVIIAMKRIAKSAGADKEASWVICGDAIGRDKSSSHRLYNTWRDDPMVLKHATAIVEKYKAAA